MQKTSKWLLIMIASVLSVMIAFTFFGQTPTSVGASQATKAALESRITALESRVTALESRSNPNQASPTTSPQAKSNTGT
ncbi:MAG: hypothetical protein FD167_2157, partial [bacterium]